LRNQLQRLREKRWINLFIVNLRIVLGFAFVPAGLKKVLGQPFTDPQSTGAFHELLHAFHATGVFYQFVGLAQLTIAVLLMTQRFATLGALMAVPVFATIAVFCWSTKALFTAVMVTLMLLASVTLALWDFDKWRGIFRADGVAPEPTRPPSSQLVDTTLWQRCGLSVLAVYLGICAYTGGIYRPRHVELDNPAFYVFPLLVAFPIATFALEQRRRKRMR
jgi:uncharacterized membrane protein YphA (DoxX/SURF4 family)